jgi:hypothetical protein
MRVRRIGTEFDRLSESAARLSDAMGKDANRAMRKLVREIGYGPFSRPSRWTRIKWALEDAWHWVVDRTWRRWR